MGKNSEVSRSCLDDLAACLQCNYLSDLRFFETTENLVGALMSLNAEDYTKEAWEEAFLYIMGSGQTFQNSSEGKEELIKWGKEKRKC